MKYLFIGSHLDDIEVSCGATIAKMVKENEVHYMGLSPCHNPIALELEAMNATKTLGIPRKNVKCFSFPVRYFNAHRQDIADLIIRATKEIEPDIVFSHSTHDKHPDHRCVAEETQRVFKGSLITYAGPWNAQLRENYFVSFDSEVLKTKIEAIKCYHSQSERPYTQPEFIEGMARTTGIKCNSEFAEGFEIIRLIQ